MKTLFNRFFSSLPVGSRLLVLLFALGFPLAMVGQHTRAFALAEWVDMSPALFWHGEVWRAVSYAFLANGVVDWVVSLFWLATLVSVLGRNWSGRELWVFCLVPTLTGALLLAVVRPGMQDGVVGNSAMIFGLLAAWYRLYGRERLILLGIGELSVRQAAILVAFIELLITGFGLGWLVTAIMLCGGAAGWLYLVLRSKHALSRRSQTVDSERIARLEL
jgi:membrane associated rhomboid family serine protease